MSQWSDRYEASGIDKKASTLEALLIQASEKYELDTPTLEAIQRLQSVHNLISKTLEAVDPHLAVQGAVDQISKGLV